MPNAVSMKNTVARQEYPENEEYYNEEESYEDDPENGTRQPLQCVTWKDMPKEAFEQLLTKLDGGDWTRENDYEITYSPSEWCCGIDEIFVQKDRESKPFLKFVRDLGIGEPTYSAQFFGKKDVNALGFFNINREVREMWSNYPRSYEGRTWFPGQEDNVCSSNINSDWDHAFTAIKTLFNLEPFSYTPPFRVAFGSAKD